jgi:hypothetical protein
VNDTSDGLADHSAIGIGGVERVHRKHEIIPRPGDVQSRHRKISTIEAVIGCEVWKGDGVVVERKGLPCRQLGAKCRLADIRRLLSRNCSCIFSLDNGRAKVQSKEVGNSVIVVLELIVGGIVALCVFGLPLATIGFYIASILEHKDPGPRPVVGALPEVDTSASELDRRRNKRAVIIYGRNPGSPANQPIARHPRMRIGTRRDG